MISNNQSQVVPLLFKNYGDWEYFFIFISLKFMSYSKDLITTVSIQFLSTWKLSVKNNSESCI